MTLSEQDIDIARKAMKFAVSNGCSACRITVSAGTSITIEWRNGHVERLVQNNDHDLYIQLYLEGRYGIIDINRIDANELRRLILKGIETTRLLSADPCRRLPAPERCWRGQDIDLQTYDTNSSTIRIDDKMQLLQQAATTIDLNDKRLVSALCTYSDSETDCYIADTNNFAGRFKSTCFNFATEIGVRGRRNTCPTAAWDDAVIYWNELCTASVAPMALQRALNKNHERVPISGRMDLVVENRVAAHLLRPVLQAINGHAIEQHNSFLSNLKNKQIAAELLTMYDNPLRPHTFGARLFDDEGVRLQPRIVIEHGILRTFYFDTYTALKTGEEPTCNAPSLLLFNGGVRTCSQICAALEHGVLVTDFTGGNCNLATGDFSYGIEGFLIENGCLKAPIAETNLSGNMLQLWQNLAEIGSDAYLQTACRMPSLRFSDICFGVTREING